MEIVFSSVHLIVYVRQKWLSLFAVSLRLALVDECALEKWWARTDYSSCSPEYYRSLPYKLIQSLPFLIPGSFNQDLSCSLKDTKSNLCQGSSYIFNIIFFCKWNTQGSVVFYTFVKNKTEVMSATFVFIYIIQRLYCFVL